MIKDLTTKEAGPPALVKKDCRDCGAKPGDMHMHGCDTERCARCGGQSISCNCIYEVNDIDVGTMEEEHPKIYNEGATEEMYTKWDKEWGNRRLPWTGIWPGVVECREMNLWCRWGPPWIELENWEPGAQENLNRLMCSGRWDQDKQTWVAR